MGLPYDADYFENLVAKPGQSFCLRLINRFRFRIAVYKVIKWWVTDEGLLSDEFKEMICAIDCSTTTTTPTTTTTTAP